MSIKYLLNVWYTCQLERCSGDATKECSSLHKTFVRVFQDESGTRFTHTQLRDNLITILFAGSDTTSITMAYMLYRVAKHPEVQERCVLLSMTLSWPGAQYSKSGFQNAAKTRLPSHLVCCWNGGKTRFPPRPFLSVGWNPTHFSAKREGRGDFFRFAYLLIV